MSPKFVQLNVHVSEEHVSRVKRLADQHVKDAASVGFNVERGVSAYLRHLIDREFAAKFSKEEH